MLEFLKYVDMLNIKLSLEYQRVIDDEDGQVFEFFMDTVGKFDKVLPLRIGVN